MLVRWACRGACIIQFFSYCVPAHCWGSKGSRGGELRHCDACCTNGIAKEKWSSAAFDLGIWVERLLGVWHGNPDPATRKDVLLTQRRGGRAAYPVVCDEKYYELESQCDNKSALGFSRHCWDVRWVRWSFLVAVHGIGFPVKHFQILQEDSCYRDIPGI